MLIKGCVHHHDAEAGFIPFQKKKIKYVHHTHPALLPLVTLISLSMMYLLSTRGLDYEHIELEWASVCSN
jgi:hypothetical protein